MRFNGAAAVAPATHPADTAAESYFVWQPPNRLITVRVLPEVLAEIGRRSAPASGGLLLGRVSRTGTYTVTVESFEGVEGQFWKAFPQPHDDPVRLTFELALARRRQTEDRSLCVVGYYRTEDTGSLLGPSNSDLMLIARYFSAPHHVFLFLRPGSATHVAMGGFACWEFGQIPETVDHEFPLDPGLLSAAAVQLPPVPDMAPAAPHHAGAGAAQGIAADPPPGRSRSGFWLIASAALLLLLIAAAAGFFLMRRTAGTASAPPDVRRLALTAERSGGDYRVTWDRNAPAVASAFKGALSIADGEFRRVIELDPAQLKGGSLLYTPMTGEALIQLDVAGPAGILTESVRVLSPAVPATAAVKPPLVVQPVAVQRPPQQGIEPAARPVVPSRGFTPPAAPASGTSPVPAPPELEAATASVQRTAPVVPLIAQAPPPEPVRERQTPVAPQPPARVSDYRPPKAIQQPRPVMTSFVRQALLGKGAQPIKVDVEITIDTSGKVSGVKPFVGGDSSLQRLWGAAAEAAKNWTFQPATLNGQAVESTMTLSFNFVGTGSR